MAKSDSNVYFWMKIYSDFISEEWFDDLMLSKDGTKIFALWTCLCLVTINSNGLLAYIDGEKIKPLTIEKIASKTRRWFSKDIIRVGLDFLKKKKLIEKDDVYTDCFRVARFNELVGSETGMAIRIRKHRESQKLSLGTKTGTLYPNCTSPQHPPIENESIEDESNNSNTRNTRILVPQEKENNISSHADASDEKNDSLIFLEDSNKEEISDEEMLSCLDKRAKALLNKARQNPNFDSESFNSWFVSSDFKSKINPSSRFVKEFGLMVDAGSFDSERIKELEEKIRVAKTPWIDKNDD